MNKVFSSGPAKQDPPTTLASRKKALLGFFPGKGLGSYHCFGPTDDKVKKLFRSAVIQFGSLAMLPNADEALRSVLPKCFCEEATAQGWTLREAMLDAQAHYATSRSQRSSSGRPSTSTPDGSPGSWPGYLRTTLPNLCYRS